MVRVVTPKGKDFGGKRHVSGESSCLCRGTRSKTFLPKDQSPDVFDNGALETVTVAVYLPSSSAGKAGLLQASVGAGAEVSV